MKIILITYNEALDGDVMEMLEASDIEHYTKWTGVLGSGEASGPHLLSHVWPKGNNVLMCCVEQKAVQPIMNNIRELRKKMGHEGLKAFLLPVDEIT